MRPAFALPAAALLLATAAPAFAQDGGTDSIRPGFGIDLFASTDADDTDVIKLTGRGLIDYDDSENYLGLAYEHAWFKPFGQQTVNEDRVYLDFANAMGSWRLKGRIGTNGDTVLGSVSLRKDDWSQEYSVEREVVETPMGLSQGIYQTYIGASYDIPVDDANVFTAAVGVQPFTGHNTRFHLRGSYVHVLDEDLGLSAQLRTRYYHSTEPGEFDYYSPEDFVQLLPMLQLRRFEDGWEFRLQAGYGAQWATGSGWDDARYAFLRINSPRNADGWDARVEVTYSNSSIASGPDYDYVAGSLGIAKAF